MALYPRVDEQHAGPALYDNGVALEELALVGQHTLRDLSQHGQWSGSPIALALLPLSPPSILVGLDRSRFSAWLLGTLLEIAKKDVRPFFPMRSSASSDRVIVSPGRSLNSRDSRSLRTPPVLHGETSQLKAIVPPSH